MFFNFKLSLLSLLNYILLHRVIVDAVILTPPYFNLVANKKVYATATCGEDINEPEFYCKLTGSTATDRETSSYANLIQGQYCYYCDPKDPARTHHANYSIDGTERWWQSPPISRSVDYNKVNLTIDFGQEFHVAYIYIKMANSPRPGLWALEKSNDFGLTYTPWQYFADSPSDCNTTFGVEVKKKIERDNQVMCTTEFSKVLPVEGGEIVVSLVNSRPSSQNFTHSDLLQTWTRATNVRLRLLRTKNLLGHLMAVAKQDPTVTRRYFYSIRDISIGGRCVCNGHAQNCDETDPEQPGKLICKCSHNTCGDQCEQCCPGYMQKKWQQNRENLEFKCEPCQCYGHSEECVYDPDVEEKRLSIDVHGNYQGGGVCQNCDHFTEGINCEKCKHGYYRPFGVPINSTDACRKCECDNKYSTGNCAQTTGQCECKPQYSGKTCDKCAEGFTEWPTCKACICNNNGSTGGCYPPCSCKFGYLGPFCDKCIDRYYGFPNCKECDCDRDGILDFNCDKLTGQCKCKLGYSGFRCDTCDNGYFGSSNSMCRLCDCDLSGTEAEICDKNAGKCICKPNFTGARCDQCAPGFFDFPNCKPCSCVEEGSIGQNCTSNGGIQQCFCIEGRGGSTCNQCAPGYFTADCIDCGCDEFGSIGQSCDLVSGKCKCKSNFIGDKCNECAPNLFNYPHCEECRCNPDGTSPSFQGCNKKLKGLKGIICPCREHVTGRQCDQCKDRYYGLSGQNPDGCILCKCERDGSFNELDICEQNSGQCFCKNFVDSLACNECKSGSYKLERNNAFGCQTCDCQVGSSVDLNCDKQTGKCECLPNIIGQKCDRPAFGYYLPSMHQFKYELEDGYSNQKRDKNVRYEFDESVFPEFSWKGYVHLNKAIGEVSQDISIKEPGTYRMIVRYSNKNSNLNELLIRVKPKNGKGDEQSQSVYLAPAQDPKFETVTVNQISALTLELESNSNEYTISFQNKLDKLYIDYFVLLPSSYFESTGLELNVEKACTDHRNEELCLQYRLISLDSYAPKVIYDPNDSQQQAVDLDSIKQFNHTYAKPAMAVRLGKENSFSRDVKLAANQNYTLLIDFLNLKEDGKEIYVDITYSDNRVQSGKVYLYKCNLTNLCREVMLESVLNVPLILEGNDDSASIKFRSNDNEEVLIYQMTLIPKEKFHLNHIKMEPHCIVKDKKCMSMDYIPILSVKIDLDESSNDQNRFHSPSLKPSDSYIQTSKTVYLNNYLPELTVPINVQPRDLSDQVLIVIYYQPNHPTVNVSINIDNKNKGSIQAAYCPSLSGCRAIVTFDSTGESFNNQDPRQITFQLTQNNKDIWIDYLLLAPAIQVTGENLQKFLPIDLTNDFISKCASEHFNIEFGKSDFCDKSAISMSAKYNRGAQPCDCDKDGSVQNSECSVFGGQCTCKENVIGRQCSKCKSGYFGFPNCQKCDCPSGNCDEETGQCLCPPNVVDGPCSVCIDTTYGFHPKFGCEECNCETISTIDGSKQCDKESGQCECKTNTDGLRCDRCKNGYYSYPDCAQCKCSKNGTTDQICDSATAECKCKENVEGNQCEYCTEGTYNLEERNPKGCTKCFCFELTSRCDSATFLNLESLSSKDLMDWKIDFGSNTNDLLKLLLKTKKSEEKGIELDLIDEIKQANIKLTDSVYWSSPSVFLGNKVTSYGGAISYKIRVRTPESSKGVIFADLILVSPNITLIHTSLRQPADQEIFENKIDLIESQFSHLMSGSSASREHLMVVLSSLKEIKLRATYFNKIHESELISFEMDHAVRSNVINRPAMNAERCECPPNHSGTSCESCEEGFYKGKSSGRGLFNCVQCQCNGHTNKCDLETGICIDCQGNTEGKNCETCKKGYHKVDLGNNRFECRICPCPGPSESNVFADICKFDINSEKVYHCECLQGYMGDYCERCSPGYYGDPRQPGGKCLPCNCNGNIDMTDFDSCNQVTGECVKCLNNTAGPGCAECAYWHYGDPIVRKDCKPCECDQCGSSSCDAVTGECKCKKNVNGYNCASCGPNQWGFNQCNGCYDCECDTIGTVQASASCDLKTGQCTCKPGITGRTCDKCEPDHWNKTEAGCQVCNCKKEGVHITSTGGFTCNSTNGQCACIPGVTGPNCDKCQDRWVLVRHQGCTKCDTCIDTLLDDLDILSIKVDGIENGNKDSSLTFKAQNKLVNLEEEFKRLTDNLDPTIYESSPLIMLQKQIDDHQRNLLPKFQQILALPLADKMKAIKSLLSEAEEFNQEINSLRNKFETLEAVLSQLDKTDLDSIRIVTDEELNIYETMVDSILNKNFNKTIDEYEDVIQLFEETNKTVNEYAANYAQQMNKIDEIKEQNLYVQKSLGDLKALILKAKNVENFSDKDVTFKAYFDNLEQIKNETNHLQQMSTQTLNKIEQIVKDAYETLASANENLLSLDKKVIDLQSVYENHDSKFIDLRKKCTQAEQKASEISRLGQNWQNKVIQLQDGLAAFEMAQIYEKIANNYNEAFNKSTDLSNIYQINDAKIDSLLLNNKDLKNKSESMLKTCNKEVERKKTFEKDYERLNREYIDLEQRSKQLEKSMTRIDLWINKTLISDTVLTNLNAELESQQNDLNTNEKESDELIKRIQALDSLRSSISRPDESGELELSGDNNLIKYIDETINELNTSVPKLYQSTLKLQQDSYFNSELEKISNDIFELKNLLATTRDIANEIKVAVNFNETTMIQLKPSVDLRPSLITSGAIFVQTREPFAPIAFIYNESNPFEYVTLYLEQGSPTFQYRLSDRDDASIVKLSTKQSINDGQWHKIEFERIGKQSRLTVYSDNDRKKEVKQESKDNSVIFNIDPNGAKILLGQFPSTGNTPLELRTMSAYNNQFKGAIDDLSLNGHSYGLWNFEKATNIKGEPKRPAKPYDEIIDNDNEKAIHFMENSFMCFSQKSSAIKLNQKNSVDMTIQFKTDTPNGLLWLWSNDEKQYISVYLDSGYVNVALVLSSDEKLTLFESYSQDLPRLDDNKYHKIYTKISVRKATDGTNMQELEIIVREIIGTEQSKIIGQIVHKLNRKPFVRNGQQCIGGIRKREGIFKDAHFTSFIGCISMLLVPYMDSKPIDLPEIVRTSNEIQLANVAPKCPGEANQCQFNKDSGPNSSDAVYLQFDLDKYPEREEETIGISFVTANPNGILFYKSESRRSKNTGILLELKERRLQLTYYEGDSSYTIPFVDKKQYSDNKLHNVYLIKHKSMILLRVDDQLVATSDKSAEASEQDQNIPITSNSLYIAGIPESERSLLNEESFNNFEGCILQVIYNNNEIKFKEATNPRSSNKISFAKCYKPVVRSALLNIPGYKQLQALIVNLKQVNNKQQQQQQQQIETILSQEVNNEEDQTASNEKQLPVKDIEECALSKQYDSSQLRPVGLRFGLSKNSRLEVHDSFAVKITTFVSFKFRTLQSEGLMFYASDSQNNDFISIWLQDGYVNYAFDCGSGFMHVKSKRTYSDGRYHTVSIVRDKQNGVLTLSDRTNTTVVETIADKSIGEASALSIVEPYYFGSIPEVDKNSLPAAQSDLIITEPFVGCMSDFIIAYKPLKNKIEKIDLMNCSNNHESGLFFTGVSLTSHASLSNYLTLKDTFEINFEIKSRTKNGVILYAGGDENNNDYVLLELNNGELNYKWNVDGMTNLVKFTPKLARNELCNSSWIRIKLRKEDKGRIMLEIKGNQIINNFNKEIIVKNDMVNLYLGALPVRSSYAEISQTNEPFIGCIRDLAIKKNNGLYANNKALLGMDLQDGVLNYCPLK